MTQRQARFEDHLSEVLQLQAQAASNTVVLASDEESPEPRSKLRRRWRLQATTAPVTPPPLEDSPGSSGTRLSSWQLVNSNDIEVGGTALSAEASASPPAPLLLPSHSLPPRPSLRHLSKGSSWKPPSVCMRYNSPFQLGRSGVAPKHPVPRKSRVFGKPLLMPHQAPLQHSAFPSPAQAKPLPCFATAADYSAYPKFSRQGVVESVLRTPKPVPIQPSPALPGSRLTGGGFAPPVQLAQQSDGFQSSSSLHAEAALRNQAMFEDLCQAHGHLSSALQEISQSNHAAELRSRLLSKVSDTTAARYLRSVQIFFSTFQELGGSLNSMEPGLFLDTFFALARSSEEGPLSNSQNVIKALRWYRKLLGLQPFPDLYSSTFAAFTLPSHKDKRESLPLPLSFCAFLERLVLSEETQDDLALWCGSFLACISASLRFSDAQHVKWSSLCVSHFSLRGICFRAKTSKREALFAFVSFGPHSSNENLGSNWLGRWIMLLDAVWFSLQARFGGNTTPDCLFFSFEAGQFAPASYAQTLLRLRQLLEMSGLPASQSGAYTLHSMKSTFLSWMAQLEIPLTSRFLQGHHQVPGSAQLYSRDDIWPALRAQLLLWKAIHAGFMPMRPQHRGGQVPVQEPRFDGSGFQWREWPITLRCFEVNDDNSTFLSWQHSDAALSSDAKVPPHLAEERFAHVL